MSAHKLDLLDVEATIEIIREICTAHPTRRAKALAFDALGGALRDYDPTRGHWIPFRDQRVRCALEQRTARCRGDVVRYDAEP